MYYPEVWITYHKGNVNTWVVGQKNEIDSFQKILLSVKQRNEQSMNDEILSSFQPKGQSHNTCFFLREDTLETESEPDYGIGNSHE